jgi:L-alanine-DL-glutamate epimerase-like enolase superfamily enzyme
MLVNSFLALFVQIGCGANSRPVMARWQCVCAQPQTPVDARRSGDDTRAHHPAGFKGFAMPANWMIRAQAQTWPIKGAFTIARGSKTAAHVVVAEIEGSDGAGRRHVGRGECVPYARYGETIEGVLEDIARVASSLGTALGDGPGAPHGPCALAGAALSALMPAGAARNALDCALWDWQAKARGQSVHDIAGLAAPRPVLSAYTISLGQPEDMARAAHGAMQRGFGLLKIKLGQPGDAARLSAVRDAVPQARLIVDANEGWSEAGLGAMLGLCAQMQVELVEQPLPAGHDQALALDQRPVAVCADESVHTTADLERLRPRYDALNIKLDKTGGLTEALVMMHAARQLGFDIMVGCMVATSLAMAPAVLLAQQAKWADLDGPMLLERDREPGLRTEGALIWPASPALWG